MIFSAQHESPMFLAAVVSAAALPWAIKSFMGAISDSYPLCGGMHRAPYILIHAPLYTIIWAVFAEHAAGSSAVFAVCIFLQSWCLVWVDCMLDAIMCEMVQTQPGARDGQLQSNVWLSRSLGALIASAAGGFLLRHTVTLRDIFYATGIMLMPTAAMAIALEPRPQNQPDRRRRTVCGVIRQTISLFHETPQLMRPTAFLFGVAMVPSCGLALNYFLRNELHYTPSDFAIINVAGDAAHVFGALAFKMYVRTSNVRRTAATCIMLTALLRMLQLLLALRVSRSVALASLDEVGLSIATEFLSMPVLAVAANHIPNGCEGTAYSAVLGAANFGGTVGTFTGGAIAWLCAVTRTEFTYLWVALLVTSLMSVIPALSTHLLPECIADGSTDDGTRDSSADPSETSDPRRRCASFGRSTASCARTFWACIQDKWGNSFFRRASARGKDREPGAPRPASACAEEATVGPEDPSLPQEAGTSDQGPATPAAAPLAAGAARSSAATPRPAAPTTQT